MKEVRLMGKLGRMTSHSLLATLVTTLVASCSTQTASYHFKQLEKHEEYMRDVTNYQKQGKFDVISPKVDSSYHLEELVKLGEMRKVTYRFPKLKNTKENTLKWMRFASQQQTPFEASAEGNAGMGNDALEFTLWFQPKQQAVVDHFIDSYPSKVERTLFHAASNKEL